MSQQVNQLTNEQVAKCVTAAILGFSSTHQDPFVLGIKNLYEATLECLNKGGLIEDWIGVTDEMLAKEEEL